MHEATLRTLRSDTGGYPRSPWPRDGLSSFMLCGSRDRVDATEQPRLNDVVAWLPLSDSSQARRAFRSSDHGSFANGAVAPRSARGPLVLGESATLRRSPIRARHCRFQSTGSPSAPRTASKFASRRFAEPRSPVPLVLLPNVVSSAPDEVNPPGPELARNRSLYGGVSVELDRGRCACGVRAAGTLSRADTISPDAAGRRSTQAATA